MRLRNRSPNISTAQKCLNIDEITRIIVTDLLERGLLGTAAAMGTTCRSLFLTTIPELWRSLPSVVPLLLLLPRKSIDIVKVNTKGAHCNQDAQKASLFVKMWQRLRWTTNAAKSWRRFELYSPFVRELGDPGLKTYICDYADVDVLCALDTILKSRCAEHGSITPRLTQLRWPLNHAAHANWRSPDLSVFLAESLVHFEVFGDPGVSAFKDIANFAPRLRHLAVMMPEILQFDEEVGKSMSATLCSARSLETLSWHSHLPCDWLSHISNIPGLRRLHLRLPLPGSQHSMTAGTPILRGVFAALRVLVLTSENADDALDFLSYARSAPLCSFMLVTKIDSFSASDHPTKLSRIQHHHGRTLTFLRLNLWRYSWPLCPRDSASQYTHPFLHDAPIASSSGMASLGDSASCTSDFTDSALRKLELDTETVADKELPPFLAPTLHELVINENNCTFTTLSALCVIADHCPQLRRLTLPLRFGSYYRAHRKYHTLRDLPELVYLNVVKSEIDDVHDVARFLSRMCPQLSAVEWSTQSMSDVNKAKWQEVNEILADGMHAYRHDG